MLAEGRESDDRVVTSVQHDTTEGSSPQWYPIASQPGTWAWWDGTRWTTFSRRVDDHWEYVPAGWSVPPGRRAARKPPSKQRVVAWFVAAALLFASMAGFGVWGYNEMERQCRKTNPQDVSACVSDASFGVDFIGAVLFISGGVCIAIGIVGAARRQSAQRAERAATPS